VAANELCYARYDIHPVSPGHLLVIPFRHVASYFDTTDEEKMAVTRLIDDCRALTDQKLHPDGYNIGVNVGEAAGQNIMHVTSTSYRATGATPRRGTKGACGE
jgi:diadenosine tetraphosphate (Ap4A) HIT family hydrolase